MKKENIAYVILLILVFLGLIHHHYANLSISFGYVTIPPLLLFIALIPSKKIREPDYSTTLNFVGILFFIISYVIYFIHIFDIWQNGTIEFIFILIFAAYGIFLSWYKGRFWS
jgi:hypothetical protein